MSKEDYAHGVEQASFIYQNVINEYVAENAKLRELCKDMFRDFVNCDFTLREGCGRTFMAATRYEPRMRELGIEVKLVGE